MPPGYSQILFRGMRDHPDPTSADPRLASLLRNCYPEDAEVGSALVGRMGFQQAGAQLGSGSNRQGQRVYQYTKWNGTTYTVAFVGGLMYTFNWGTRTWTQVTLSGVSLSATARVYCVTFANYLVVSDGVNRPWTWDGTSFVDLTNAPIAYGPPTVYYGKLFLIKNSDRSTFVWSEENLPNTGYEAGGANNAWQFTQTDTEPLVRLIGTNEYLYIFRERSIASVSGAVTATFSSDGTRDGVSEKVGTTAPGAVIYDNGKVWFLSAEGRPHLVRPGGGVVEMWQDCRETARTLPRSLLPTAEGVYEEPTGLIRFAVGALSTDTHPTIEMVFDARREQFVARFDGFEHRTLDVVTDANGVKRIMHTSNDGYVYDHGVPDEDVVDDGFNAGVAPVKHEVVGSPLTYDTKFEKIYDRIDIVFRAVTTLTALTFSLDGPLGRGPLLTFDQGTGASGLWDIMLWDLGVWAIEAGDRHVALGLDGLARWAQAHLTHQRAGEAFALLGWTLEAVEVGADVSAV